MAATGIIMLILSCTVASCSSQPQAALQAIGPSTRIGDLHPAMGQIQRFAFPIMRNATKKPVTVTDFKLIHPPPGIKILDYHVYSFKDTGGEYPTSSTDGAPNGGGTGLPYSIEDLPDTYGRPFTIAPGKGSDYFAMVRFLLVTDPPRKGETLSGCEVTYTVDHQVQRQVLACEYELTGPDSPERRQTEATPTGG